jgi:hypothetical protein
LFSRGHFPKKVPFLPPILRASALLFSQLTTIGGIYFKKHLKMGICDKFMIKKSFRLEKLIKHIGKTV